MSVLDCARIFYNSLHLPVANNTLPFALGYSGNVDKMSKAVTPGFLNVLNRRLSRRANMKMQWGFARPPRTRLILDTIAQLPYQGAQSPVPSENIHLMRQAVIRISGEQRLRQGEIVDKRSKIVRWDQLPIIVREPEYVVIQQKTIRGKTGPWMIWGTAQETTPADWADMRERQGHRAAVERSKMTNGLL